MSLRLRLLVALVPLFVIGLAVADVVTYTSLQSFLVSRVDGQLESTHHDVEDVLTNGSFGGPPQHGGGPGGGPGNMSSIAPGTFAEIVSASGSVLAGPTNFVSPSDTGNAGEPVLPSNLAPGGNGQATLSTAQGTGEHSSYRVLVEPVNSGTTSNALLVVAIPLDDVTSTLHQLLLLELAISGGVTLIIIALSWVIVRRGMRPLVRMGDTARSIVASDLSRRVEPASERTEVGRLGIALNTMLAQLEDAFAERQRNEVRLRHFISDASHELRTPLTSIQGYAEMLRRNPEMTAEDAELAMRRMEEETKRMGVLVDDLLLLARLDQGRPLGRGSVDLDTLVRDAVADARAADPGRAITIAESAPLVVQGDEMRLRQVLGNLLRNASVHTPPATPVEVRLRRGDGVALIEVADHGPGIPAEQRGHIFERFHRADPDRSRDQRGSGLGLSIVAAVVAAHGGAIRVDDTAGGGATFVITLPLVNGPVAQAVPAPPGA